MRDVFEPSRFRLHGAPLSSDGNALSDPGFWGHLDPDCGGPIQRTSRDLVPLKLRLPRSEVYGFISITAAMTRTLKQVPRSSEIELVIGPEGGWTDREVQALASAGMLVTLGGHTLRADAVPLVAVTALRVAWDDF